MSLKSALLREELERMEKILNLPAFKLKEKDLSSARKNVEKKLRHVTIEVLISNVFCSEIFLHGLRTALLDIPEENV